MARRKNIVSHNLVDQKTIHAVGSFDEALHLFLRDDKIRNLSEATLKYYKAVNSTAEQGRVYEVLSVGMARNTAIATIKEGREVTAYRLPNGLNEWVLYSMNMSKQGFKALPAKIEFGNLYGIMYAESYSKTYINFSPYA